MAIFNIMYTDGYIQLVDKHLRETPISTTPFPNYVNSCSNNTPTDKSGVIRKIPNTVAVPGFVAYPCLDDPFDDAFNIVYYLFYLYNSFPDSFFEINKYFSLFSSRLHCNSNFGSSYVVNPDYNDNASLSIQHLSSQSDILRSVISFNLTNLSYVGNLCMLGGVFVTFLRYIRGGSILYVLILMCYNKCPASVYLATIRRFLFSSYISMSTNIQSSTISMRSRQKNKSYPDSSIFLQRIDHPKLDFSFDDMIFNFLSQCSILDVEFVISKLSGYYEVERMIDHIFNLLDCPCFLWFDYYNSISANPVSLPYSFLNYTYESHRENMIVNEHNNICICLIIKYKLYPGIKKSIRCLYDKIGDVMSVSFRKFDGNRNNYKYVLERYKLIFLLVLLVRRISVSIVNRYFGYVSTALYSRRGGVFKCLCSKYDSSYIFFVNLLVYICSMIEKIFEEEETTGDAIQSLSILVNELSSISHPTKDKCPPEQQSAETQSPAVQTGNNVILTWFYKSIISLFSSNIKLNDRWNVSFVIKLNSLAHQLSVLTMVMNMLISSRMNNYIMRELGNTGCTISKNKSGKNLLEFFRGFVSLLSFTIGNGDCLYKQALQHIENITDMVFSVFFSIVCKKQEQKKENECLFKDPPDRIIVASCISLIYYFYNDLSLQLSNKVVLDFMVSSEDSKSSERVLYYLTRRTISYPENMCKHSRTNRICDSTSVINNNKLEGGSNNNYTYNDAYRINTSRAHGSLKYIIIKIVLILIIVVMTIFHPRCR